MTGQEACRVAEVFDEVVDITGVILTKMDSDARGGAALSIAKVTGKPIKFISVGEKIGDFEIFTQIGWLRGFWEWEIYLHSSKRPNRPFDKEKKRLKWRKNSDGKSLH